MSIETEKLFNCKDIPGFKEKVTLNQVDMMESVTRMSLEKPYRERTEGIEVCLEETGENIVPYLGTELWINLDTGNLIYEGNKNATNIVFYPLYEVLKDRGLMVTRDEILYVIEQFVFTGSLNNCFTVGYSGGSLIASTLSSYINGMLKKIMYDDVKELEYRHGLRDVSLGNPIYRDYRGSSGKGVWSPEFWTFNVIKLLRTVDKDYYLRSCLDAPGFTEKIIKSLGLNDLSPGAIKDIEKVMKDGKFDIDESADYQSEFFEKYIDLNRVVRRIKEVVK